MDQVQDHESSYHGHYERGWLNGMFGKDGYTVKSFKLAKISSDSDAFDALEDPTLSLAYMSDEKLTCLWVHEHPGWLKFCEPAGIVITPSSKIAKRLTVLTRLSWLHLFKDPDEITILGVKPDEFTVEDSDEYTTQRFLDGANVISRELIEEMITSGSELIDRNFMNAPIGKLRGNPYEKARITRSIDEAGSASIRVMTPDGLIKGDTLIVPRAQMPGDADILYCTENLKSEVKSLNKIFVLIEPHPGMKKHKFSSDQLAPPAVWSDDQSMSWLGDWLFPPAQLIESLKDFAENTYSEIEQGRYPTFFTDAARFHDEFTTITQFQSQAIRWSLDGLGLDKSIFLQERIGHGAINQLSSKTRWPIPCAMYVHVATDSWLHMAGFYDPETGEHPWPFEKAQTPRGSVWLHEETSRLIYNDLDFAEAYQRHGGWDLDDSVRAHARTMGNKRVFINVRSPNSMGEYDIKNYVDGTFAPVWTDRNGDVIEFPEVSRERPPFIEELDITYQYPDNLSHETLGVETMKHDTYTLPMVKHSVEMALRFRGVFGRRANADMVYFATFHDYRRQQLAPIEAIVDACTQEQSDEALELINTDREDILDAIRYSGVTVDRLLWEKRAGRFEAGMKYQDGAYTRLASTHQTYCEIYKAAYFDLAQRTPDLTYPEIFELGAAYKNEGQLITKWFYELRHTLDRDVDETNSRFYQRINDMVCAHISKELTREETYDLVLGIASFVYSNLHGSEYKDTVLFQDSTPGRESIFNFYLEAIKFYGIGDNDWYTTLTCPRCRVNRHYTDRLEFQKARIQNHCPVCPRT